MEQQVDSTTINSVNEQYPIVTRQDILNFPFPYKLWFVVHLDFCDFLRWNRDGTIILLDIVTLEEYLDSSRSIFKIKNRSTFLDHLKDFGFSRVNTTAEQDEDLTMQYQHENFLRHRIDLLAKIRIGGTSALLLGDNKFKSNTTEQIGPAAKRMPGDLCFMSHGCLSSVQKCRLHYQTVLKFHSETKVLHEKLLACDQSPEADVKANEDAVIELPIELFENPHDSVLHMDNESRPDYAGYYGTCSKDQILNFFGDYLPMYEQKQLNEDGTMAIDESKVAVAVAEIEGAAPEEPPKSNAMNYEIHCSVDLNATLCVPPPNLAPTLKTPPLKDNLEMSSTLEPIFLNDHDDDVKIEEADISMEDFIKFNENNSLPVGNVFPYTTDNGNNDIGCISVGHVFPDKTDDENNKIDCVSIGQVFPNETNNQSKEQHQQQQVPEQIKIEMEENLENEANFRNFFHQYRESLSLLYDKH